MSSTEAQTDDSYRAIGRYVVSFSQLVYFMRAAMTERLAPGNGFHLVELAIGEAAASQLSNSFFGMCSVEARLENDADRRIAKALKQNVEEEITRRNDIAHGDWWVWAPEGSSTVPPPALVRLKPGRGTFPKPQPWRGVEEELSAVETARERGEGHPKVARTVEAYTTADLDALSESVMELARVTSDFGRTCLAIRPPGQRIELQRRFVVRDKRVRLLDPSTPTNDSG